MKDSSPSLTVSSIMCLNVLIKETRLFFLVLFLAKTFSIATAKSNILEPSRLEIDDNSWTVKPLPRDDAEKIVDAAKKEEAERTTTPKPKTKKEEYIPYQVKEEVYTYQSKMERDALKQVMIQMYAEEVRKKKKKPYYQLLQEYNKKQHYVSKGTCDRRAVKVCKNACLRTIRNVCGNFECDGDFKEDVKKNCRDICTKKFNKEFDYIF